jgi:hypothetical protein
MEPITKMKRLLITLIAGLFAVTTAQARIGWTLDQCRKQYGEPQNNGEGNDHTGILQKHQFAQAVGKQDQFDGEWFWFITDEWTLDCKFFKGKVVDILYRPKVGKYIPVSICAELMKKNAGNFEWELSGLPKDPKSFMVGTKGVFRNNSTVAFGDGLIALYVDTSEDSGPVGTPDRYLEICTTDYYKGNCFNRPIDQPPPNSTNGL